MNVPLSGYCGMWGAILRALRVREMTTDELAAEIGASPKNTLAALARLAKAERVWVPRRQGKAHVWARVRA